MSYVILERLLKEELQERLPLKADCLVTHSTANPGVGDENHFKWLDADRRHGWAHFYVDDDSISQLVSEGFMGPAQGPTMNLRALSVEMCEPSVKLPMDKRVQLFNETWKRTIWLEANILFRYGWPISALWSHAMVSTKYPQDTDHQDPLAFFATYGKKWDNFVSDVQVELDKYTKLPDPAAWQTQIIDSALTDGLIHERRHPLQVVTWWEFLIMLQRTRS